MDTESGQEQFQALTESEILPLVGSWESMLGQASSSSSYVGLPAHSTASADVMDAFIAGPPVRPTVSTPGVGSLFEEETGTGTTTEMIQFCLQSSHEDDEIRRDLIEHAFRAWVRGSEVDLDPFNEQEVAIFSTLLYTCQEGLERGHDLEWPDQAASHQASKAQCNEAITKESAVRGVIGPRDLVDSGANEMIRLRPEGCGVHRCRRTQVTMASGDVMDAFWTRDGELMLGDETSDAEAAWILIVRRLRGIGGRCIWDDVGPRVSYMEGGHREWQDCYVNVENGLPYLT